MIDWKVVGIILLVVLILENLLIGWGMYINWQEEKKTNECYYNFCSAYVDAVYVDGVCTCYEYDNLGYLIVGKEGLI